MPHEPLSLPKAVIMPRLTQPSEAIPFIITTQSGQIGGDKRKLIRSHVMRGKNRKKQPSRPQSWISGGEVGRLVDMTRQRVPPVPAKVGGEFSFTALSAEIGPDTLESIWKLKRIMFPLDFDPTSHQTEQSWLEPILSDPACFHFTLFISKMYHDHIHGQKDDNNMALSHSIKALTILQQRLAGSDHELPTSDSTILVVVGLTMAATALGDLETATKHLMGLRKMVDLRGGISAFKVNRQLQTKILRIDLGVTLSMGCSPLFFSEGISWDSYIASQGRIPISEISDIYPTPHISISDLGRFLDSMDVRLRCVWGDVSEFARAANIVAQCKLSIDNELYQEVMVSIHYRLVNLHYDVGDVNETIRLALLAFASALFLQWRGIETRYEYLAQCLNTAISSLKHKTREVPGRLTLWLYIVADISVFNENEKACLQPALTQVLRYMKLESWNEVRSILKSVLWVEALHDLPAKQIVEDALLAP